MKQRCVCAFRHAHTYFEWQLVIQFPFNAIVAAWTSSALDFSMEWYGLYAFIYCCSCAIVNHSVRLMAISSFCFPSSLMLKMYATKKIMTIKQQQHSAYKKERKRFVIGGCEMLSSVSVFFSHSFIDHLHDGRARHRCVFMLSIVPANFMFFFLHFSICQSFEIVSLSWRIN